MDRGGRNGLNALELTPLIRARLPKEPLGIWKCSSSFPSVYKEMTGRLNGECESRMKVVDGGTFAGRRQVAIVFLGFDEDLGLLPRGRSREEGLQGRELHKHLLPLTLACRAPTL